MLLPVIVLTITLHIEFGLSSTSHIIYENKASFCSISGHDYSCSPPFTNLMKHAGLSSSSNCGSFKSENICPFWKYYFNRNFVNDCQLCYRKLNYQTYSLDNLRDSINSNYLSNQTCWFSGAIFNQPNSNYVNITIDFGKLFEIYYISIQFCSAIPDAVAIYKSSDNTKTWTPWHFYSKNCRKHFNKPGLDEYEFLQEIKVSPFDAKCLDLNRIKRGNRGALDESVLPFSTAINRKLNETVIEWISVTNIRIMLMRFDENSKSEKSNNGIFDYSKYFFGRDRKGREILNMSLLNKDLLQPELLGVQEENDLKDGVYYGVSDLSIGGRCQCNGHGNTCVKDQRGNIQCDCRHNTGGRNCERCMDGYNDRPWSRGTHNSVTACSRCHCNLHSSTCKFSQMLFESSGGRSGGICHKCLHNTAGQHCQQCQDGFHRDWTKPLSHEHACIKCNCHSVGSKSPSICDKKTGQCYCKSGVTGKKCDRCKLGYRETVSIHTPCVKKYKIPGQFKQGQINGLNQPLVSDPHYQYMANTESECKPCNEKRKRIRFKKFCRRNAVVMGTIQSKEVHGKMVRFEMLIQKVWRVQNIKDGKNNDIYNPLKLLNLQPSSLENSNHEVEGKSSIIPLWISREDIRCECPSIYLGRQYLVLTKFIMKHYRNRQELLLEPPQSVVLPWRISWNRRLHKFTIKSKQGRCQRFFQRKKSKIKNIYQLNKRYFRQLPHNNNNNNNNNKYPPPFHKLKIIH